MLGVGGMHGNWKPVPIINEKEKQNNDTNAQ